MVCVTSMSFVVLINGVGSPFFQLGRGLGQGCPLYPYLFILVVDGLSHLLAKAKGVHQLQGLKVERHERLSHLLFEDDILIFCYCVESDGRVLKEIMDLFCDVAGMVINITKHTIFFSNIEVDQCNLIATQFNFPSHELSNILMYLGYVLKPNNYGVTDELNVDQD
jgi:hypothetical protein